MKFANDWRNPTKYPSWTTAPPKKPRSNLPPELPRGMACATAAAQSQEDDPNQSRKPVRGSAHSAKPHTGKYSGPTVAYIMRASQRLTTLRVLKQLLYIAFFVFIFANKYFHCLRRWTNENINFQIFRWFGLDAGKFRVSTQKFYFLLIFLKSHIINMISMKWNSYIIMYILVYYYYY